MHDKNDKTNKSLIIEESLLGWISTRSNRGNLYQVSVSGEKRLPHFLKTSFAAA